MIRYGKVKNKNRREIVLLKGYPCVWGKCRFCDYITDNGTNEQKLIEINREVLSHITGEYSAVEVINSGSVFELPETTLADIKQIAENKDIRRLFFESHYSYKHKLGEMREYLGREIIYKCGIETFDDDFRNKVLRKGIIFDIISDVSDYFDSICLLVGIQGQTKEMIIRDIDILLEHFRYGCVNLYTDNTTEIKADINLQECFKEKYSYLEQCPNIDVLWNNTDFGVGGNEI